MHPDKDKHAAWWIGGLLANVFTAHPILTVVILVSFFGGAVLGGQIGFGMSSFIGCLVGIGIGAVTGVISILILYLILIIIGVAG